LRAAGVGGSPAEHFVQQQPERVQVAARVHRFRARLLRRQVVGVPTTVPVTVRPREPRERAMPKSEIQARPFRIHQHVRRLEVAVDHAARMRGRQAERHLACDRQRLLERQAAFAVDDPVQRLALDQVHADQPASLVLADVVDAHHVRARHLARQQQFLAEAFEGAGRSAISLRSSLIATGTPSCRSVAR
jgi:hypothetical protein